MTAVDTEGHLKNDNGLLQGAMVWAVAIPLTTYLAASTVGGVVGTAGRAVAGGVQATATVAQDAAKDAANDAKNSDAAKRVTDANNAGEAVDRAKQEATAATQKAGDAAKAAGEQLKGVKDQVVDEANRTFTPQNLEAAAGYGAKASWGVLGSMLLALIAAAVGGVIGGKTRSATVTLEPAR